MKSPLGMLILMISIVFAHVLQAQPPGGRAGMEERWNEIVERLELTEEQEAAVGPIVQASIEQRRAVLNAHGVERGKGRPDAATMDAVRSEMKAITRDTEAQLATVLDEQQMAEYREIKRELKGKWKNRKQAQGNQQGAAQQPSE